MKSVFHISPAVILFTAMLIGSGNKKSDAPKSDTTAFQVAINVDPNLVKYPGDMDGRILYIFSNDREGQDHCTGQWQLYRPAFNVTGLTASMPGPGLDYVDVG